jgi:hypothetical protein
MNENIEMKPVIDLMGATKKVLTNMAEFFEKARDDAKDRMISPEKFWSYLTKELKTECKIQDDQLLLAGMPTQLVMDTLSLDEAEPVKSQTLTYKNLYLTMKDKSTKKLPIEQVAAKIAPFTKNFKSAMEALVMGDPEAILKVFQHVYGKDVEQWSVPAEESAVHSRFSALAALALSEMYRVGKFNMPSCMFEMKDSKLLVNEAGIKQLVDGFEKADRAWLVSMFPHVVADYLHNIINETKSVLNELPKEVVDKLFVNINPEYLKNLKESELKELAAKFAEAVVNFDRECFTIYEMILKHLKEGIAFDKQKTLTIREKVRGHEAEFARQFRTYINDISDVAISRKVVDSIIEVFTGSMPVWKESELKELAAKFAEATQPKPEEVTKSGGKTKQGTVGKQALPVGPTVRGGIANKKYTSKMAEATEDNVWCLVWSLEERFWILGVYPSEAAAESAKSALEVSSISSDLVGKGYERLRGEPAEEIEDGMLMVVDKEGLLGAWVNAQDPNLKHII